MKLLITSLIISSFLISKHASTTNPAITLNESTDSTLTLTITVDSGDPVVGDITISPTSDPVAVITESSTTDNQFTISGLLHGTCYSITYSTTTEKACTKVQVSPQDETTSSVNLNVDSSSGDVTAATAVYTDKNGTPQTVDGTVTGSAVSIAVITLQGGTKYTAVINGIAVTYTGDTVNNPADPAWAADDVEFCSKPEPVQTVALTAGTTPSLDSISLTVTLLNAPVNADSVMKIVPTCGTTAESEQDCSASPNCTVSALSVAGCEYTMAVRMVCEVSGQNPVASTVVSFDSCTKPDPVQSIASAAAEPTTSSVTLTIGMAADGSNPNSVMKIVPKCGENAAETEQGTCDGSIDCAVTGLLVPGCNYLFTVRMACESADREAVDSEIKTFSTCTQPAIIDTGSIDVDISPVRITITGVTSTSNGVYDTYGIKSIDGSDQTDPLSTEATGLTAGTCYNFGIVLLCGTLEGDVATAPLCSGIPLTVGSQTTTGATLTWPMDGQSLTANSVSVTTYSITVDSSSAQAGTASVDFAMTDLNPPGSVHNVSASVILDNGQTLQSDAVNFCLKPEMASVTAEETSATLDSIALTALAVTSGDSSGFEVELSGCSLAATQSVDDLASASVQFTSLISPGCLHNVTIKSYCETGEAKVYGDDLVFKQCTEPDKVTAVTVAADSITTNSINLMITKPTGNPNSVIAVEPICESTAEDEQYPVCTGTEDEVVCVIDSLLRAGCSYTFKVRMICGKDEAAPSNRIYSAEVNLTSCIIPNDVLPKTNFTFDTTSITLTGIHQLNSSGMFEDFWFVVNPDITSEYVKTVSGLEPGSCHMIEVVLQCGVLYGSPIGHKYCTQHEVEIQDGSETLEGVTLIAPIDAGSSGVTVTSYTYSVDDVESDPKAAPLNEAWIITGITPPGSVHNISTTVRFSINEDSESATIDFCLKPEVATIPHDQTTVGINDFTLTNMSVANGKFTGHKVVVSGAAPCELTAVNNIVLTGGNVSFAGLIPGCIYDVVATSFCQPDGTGDDAGKVEGAPLTEKQCTRPENLDATDLNFTSDPTNLVDFGNIKVTAGQASVRISMTSPGYVCTNKSAVIPGVTAEAPFSTGQITGLIRGCPYDVTIQPFCETDASSEESIEYNSASHVDRQLCTIPDVISGMNVSDPTVTDTLEVKSVSVTDGSSFVDLQVNAWCEADNSVSRPGLEFDSDLFNITGLSPGCPYVVGVSLRCYFGSDASSAKVGAQANFTFCTKPVPPNLGAISAIETAAFSIAGISVASGFASKYSISIRCNQTATPDAEVWGNSTITDGSAAIAVDSLVPGCKHEIKIASFCVVEGDTPNETKSEDEIVYQCTKPLAFTAAVIGELVEPTLLEIVQVGNEAHTYWSTYTVQVISSEEVSDFEILLESNTDATLNVSGLTPATMYNFTITPYCDQIAGDEFAIKNIVTEPLPLNFTISTETSSSCEITVELPTDGTATFYQYAFSISNQSAPTTFGDLDSSRTRTFESLSAATDYTIYAKVKYNHTGTDREPIDSEVSSMVCKTSPLSFSEVEIPEADIGSVSLKIKATYPSEETLEESTIVEIRAFVVDPADLSADVEASYEAPTSCLLETVGGNEVCSKVYERVVNGLTPGTNYSFRVYAFYGSTLATQYTNVTAGKATYGCMEIGDDGCELPDGSADLPENYRCVAGYATNLTSGRCADTCADGGTRPNNNQDACVASCAFGSTHCTCGDKFDLLTCLCDAGTLLHPATAQCSRNCDPGQAHCRVSDGSLCAAEGGGCFCENNYFIQVKGDEIGCTESSGSFCDPLRGDTIFSPYSGSEEDNPCNCSSPSLTSSCTCKTGYLSDTMDNTRCVDIVCNRNILSADGREGVCKCPDEDNVTSCRCVAGYGPDDNAQCSTDCNETSSSTNCIVSNSSPQTQCSEDTPENETCVCKAGFVVNYDSVNKKNVCVRGCFSTVIAHFIATEALYADADKCTCQDEFNATTCDCLAGYVMKDGVCTRECAAAVGANCITDIATRANCSQRQSGSTAECFCAPGFQPVVRGSFIDCEVLPSDTCNPSLSTVGCSCSDFHSISTCSCSSGYATDPDTPNTCVKAVQITVKVTFDVVFDSRLLETDSQTYREEKARYELLLFNILRVDNDRLVRVIVTGFSQGSTKVDSIVVQKVSDAEGTAESERQLAARTDETLNNPQTQQDNRILTVSVETVENPNVADSQDGDDGHDTLETYLLVLIILVAVVLFFLLIILIVYVCLKNQQKSHTIHGNEDEFDNMYALRSVEADRSENGQQRETKRNGRRFETNEGYNRTNSEVYEGQRESRLDSSNGAAQSPPQQQQQQQQNRRGSGAAKTPAPVTPQQKNAGPVVSAERYL